MPWLKSGGMSEQELSRFPRDVQALLVAGGVERVTKYAGRLRDRPVRKEVVRQKK